MKIVEFNDHIDDDDDDDNKSLTYVELSANESTRTTWLEHIDSSSSRL